MPRASIELKLLLFVVYVCLVADTVLAEVVGQSSNVRTEYELDAKKRDYVLLGVTVNDKILVWAGLGQDNIPWMEVIEPNKGTARKLSFDDDKLRRKVVPDAGSLDGMGKKLAFLGNRVPGVYDFVQQRGFSIVPAPQTPTKSLFSSPEWYSDSEIALFDITNRRSIRTVDLTNQTLKSVFSPPSQMFMSSYSIGGDGTLVVGLGPYDERLASIKFASDTFGIDDARAKRINLFSLEQRGNKLEPLTKGEWFDFAPKVSKRGEYVAFLRGTPNRKLQKSKIENNEEYSFSSMSPALYFYDFKAKTTKKESRVIQSPLTKTQFDFAWKDGRTLSFIKPVHAGGSALFLYDCVDGKYTEFFRTDGLISSFFWYGEGKKLTLIIRKSENKDMLVTVR